MDYFGFTFDLQLFATTTTIPMTGAGVSNADYYASIDGAAAAWVTAAEIQTALTATTPKTVVVTAAYLGTTSKTLTVAAGNGDTVIVQTEHANNTDLKDLTVTTAKAFTVTAGTGTATEATITPTYPAGTTADPATICTVSFTDKDGKALGTVSNVTTDTSTTSSTIAFGNTTAGQATVSEGCTVNGMTATGSTAVFTLADEGAAVVTGKVTVAAGTSNKAVYGTSEYANASSSAAMVLIAAAADPKLTLDSGSAKVSGATAALTLGTSGITVKSLEGGAALTLNSNGTITQAAGSLYEVTAAHEKPVVIGGVTYTEAGSGSTSTATISVAATGASAGAVTLTDGTLKLGAGVAVGTDIGIVTNSSAAGAKDITVTKAGVVAAATSTDAVAYTLSLNAKETLTLGTTTYTNASTSSAATVGVELAATTGAATVTLSSGYLQLSDQNTELVTSVGTVKLTSNAASQAIIVSNDGAITGVTNGAEFTVTTAAANQTVKIGDNSYQVSTAGALTVAKNSTTGVTTLTPATDMSLVFAGASDVIDTANGTITAQKGNGTVTVTKAGVVTATSGKAVYTAVIDAAQSLTVGTGTTTFVYANAVTSGTTTATLDVDGTNVTLSGGSVTMATAGQAITTDIGKITYTVGTGATGTDGITVAKDGTVTLDKAGEGYTADLLDGATLLGSYTAVGAATMSVSTTDGTTSTQSLTSGVVSFGAGKSLTVGSGTTSIKVDNEATSEGTIAVNTSGVVSKISAGAEFSVTTTTSGTTPTTTKYSYVMNGTTLAKTGAAVGVYTNAAAATVAANGTVSGSTVKTITLKVAEDNAAMTGKGDTGKTTKYYALYADGTVNKTAAGNTSDANAIGFFQVVTSWADTDDATPVVTVTFQDKTGSAAVTSYLGNVIVDMEKVQTVTAGTGTSAKTAALGTLVITGISGAASDDSDVTVVNINKATAITGTGTVPRTDWPDEAELGLTVTFDATTYGDAARLAHKDSSGTFDQYGVYAKIGADWAWYKSVAAVKSAATSAGKTYTIGARYEGGVLTVANGGDGKKVVLADSASTLTAANLKDVSIQTVESFNADGVATTGTGTSVVDFGTVSGLAGIQITTTLGESVVCDATTGGLLRATIPSGATVVCNGQTYMLDAASVMTLVANGATTYATLDNGSAIVKAGDKLAVGSNVYETGEAAATITSTSTKDTSGAFVAATYGVVADGEVSVTAGTVGVKDEDGNVSTITAATGDTVKVTSAGVISGLADGDVVTVTDIKSDGTTGKATTYTVGANGTHTITVSGEFVGVYSFGTDAEKEAATITSVYGAQDTITSNGTTAKPVALTYQDSSTVPVPQTKLTLEAITGGKKYYTVSTAGVVTTTAVVAPTSLTGLLGYFEVTTSTDGGKTTVGVVFHNADTTGTVGTLLSGVELDLTNFQTLAETTTTGTIYKPFTTVDVSGLSAGKVTLTNVPYSAASDIVGLKEGDADVDYFARYELGTSTITLPSGAKDAGSGTVWTYAVTAGTKAAETGIRTYSIGKGEVLVGTVVKPCFTVTKTVGTDGKATYTVAYEAATVTTDELDALDQACWANGVTVDASALSAGDTVTVIPSAGGVDVYTVKAAKGIIVGQDTTTTSRTDAAVEGDWGTPAATTITYYGADGKALADQYITLPKNDTTGDITEYWVVTKVNDGKNEIKITKQTSAPATGDNYLTVTNTAGSKTVTVSYHVSETSTASAISLSDIGANVALRAESADITTITLNDGKKEDKNCVDFQVTAYAGTNVKNLSTGDVIPPTYIAQYKNAAVINLDALAADTYAEGTYYYAVTAGTEPDEQGYLSVTLASATPTTGTVPETTANYFAVTKGASGAYTVTYHAGTDKDTAITFAAGQATLAVNGNENVRSINKITANASDYTVTDATKKFASLKTTTTPGGTPGSDESTTTPGVGDPTLVTYKEVSEFTNAGASGDATIDLSEFTTADTTPATYAITKAGTTSAASAQKGVTQYKLGAKGTAALTDAGFTVTYVPATTTEEGYIKIELTQGSLTKAEIEKIANAIKINGALSTTATTGLAGKVTKIVLTKDSEVAISYSITNLSADIALENFTDGKDKVDYTPSYVMGDENTITLTAAAADATKDAVVYYAVTATDGKDTKNVRTISISTTPVTIPEGATPAQIAEALDAVGGNYFTVTTHTDGTVDVTYTHNADDATKAIDLDGKKVNVNAAAVTEAGTKAAPIQVVTLGNEAGGDDSIAFTVSGLDVGQTAAKAQTTTTSSAATVSTSYNTSYEFAYPSAGSAIELTSATSGTVYYSVARSTTATQGVYTYTITQETDTTKAPASGHYFAVTYAATGVSMKYYNVDGDEKYNLAATIGLKPQVAVNAANVNPAITAINITDGGSADTPKVNYALKEVPADVEPVGVGEGDTVTTKPTVVLADGQKITLTGDAITYYALTGTEPDAKGKVTVTIGEGTTTKPADSVNYFVVKRTASEATGKVSYAITEYHVSNGGAAYDLTGAKVGTITIDATKATGGVTVNNGSGAAATKAHFAVTNLPEYGTDTTMAADDTVTYATTFAWPTETVPKPETGTIPNWYAYNYLVKANTAYAATVTPGETTTTAVDDGKTEYVNVTVVKYSDGTFEVRNDANTYVGDGSTGALSVTTHTAKIVSIAAPTTTAEISFVDVDFATRVTTAGSEVTPEITGVAAGSKLYFDKYNSTLAAATTQDVSVISGTLQANDKITIVAVDYSTKAEEATTFTAGEAGAIAVRYTNTNTADTILTIESGALLLGKGGKLTATMGTNTIAELTADGESDGVIVTFDPKKGITSITDLEVGETVTLTENGTEYTYKCTEDGYVVKTLASDSTKKSYAALDASTTNILSLGYSDSETITGVGTFEWGQTNATYYLEATNSGAIVQSGTDSGSVSPNALYIKAEFKSGVLELTPMRGNAKNLLDPVTDYAGTITIHGELHAVKYDKKDSDATYKVAIDGVLAGSEFTDLGSSDTVTTEALKAAVGTTPADKIRMIVTGTGGGTYDYAAGKDGVMTFTGAGLTSGTVVVDKTTATTILTSDGSKLVYASTATTGTINAIIVVEKGSITSIKNFRTDETITVTKDGVETKFETTTTAGTIKKTVKAADGSTTVSTITSVTDDTNIWTATGTTTFTNKFTWGAKEQSGYFRVPQTAAEATAITGKVGEAEVKTDTTATQEMKDGYVFIKATITNDPTKDTFNTLTLTPVIVKDGAFVETTTANVKKVTVTGTATTGTVMKYDGTGQSFNIDVQNVAAGSVFTNLRGGDLVTSVGLDKDKKISVNGQDWTSLNNGDTFTIYSESPSTSRIVAGNVYLTEKNATVNAATYDATNLTSAGTQTMTYTAGEDNKDGVAVTYAGGVPTSITGLDLGESVKIEAVDKDGKKVTTEYTTAKSSTDGNIVVYRNIGGEVYVQDIVAASNVVDDTNVNYRKVDSDQLAAFAWPASTDTTNAVGYFLASEADKKTGVMTAEAKAQAASATDYTQYGRTYLIVTATPAGGISLQKATVGINGKLGTVSNLAATDKLDVTLTLPTAGLAITSLDAGVANLTVVNAAANTKISNWGAGDHITTVSLKAGDTVELGTVYTIGKAGVLEIDGTSLVNGNIVLKTGLATISTLAKDETTGETTVDTVTYKPTGTSDTANVGATNGRLTSLTGFGAEGEEITVVTTVTDKFGVATKSTVTYKATLVQSGLNKGQIQVTKTLEDGTSFTHVFKDTTQDVLASGVEWTANGQDVTKSTFNWNNTGYFLATVDDAAKKTYKLATATDTGDAVKSQKYVPTFKDTDGNYLTDAYWLKVTATKALSGLVTISEMSFVKLQSNGTFQVVKSGETLPAFNIDATAGDIDQPSADGIAIAKDAHPDAKITITPVMGKTYTGLVAGDIVKTTSTTAGQTITVNDTAYTVAGTTGFTIHGDNTIESGLFTVTGKAEGSASGITPTSIFTKTVAYTAGDTNKDGVTVTFEDGQITSVTGLEAGETVVITNVKGTSNTLDKTITYTAAVDGGNTVVTQKIKWADTASVPATVTMVKSAATATPSTVNVMDMGGYQAKNKFDFGATEDGQVGIFAFGASATSGTIGKQNAGGIIAAGADGVYMAVAATGDATKGYTITYASLLKYTSSTKDFSPISTTTLTGGVTITAPAGASLELGKDAVQLYTAYKKDTDGNYIKDKDGNVIVDKDNTETKRGFDITVTGAAAGKSYTGFAERDTIEAGALTAGDSITVGDLTYTVKNTVASGEVSFRGNGAAVDGEFSFTGNEVRGYKAATLTDAAKLTSVTGSAKATVLFANGVLTSITDIGDNENVTVTETDVTTKATTTTKYEAKLNADGKTLTITRTVTADGVTTVSYNRTATPDSVNITKLTYTDSTASISSSFDWTTKNGSGYFFADVTLDGSTIKDIGTVAIATGTTTISPTDVGKYVAKVTVNKTSGTVDGIALHKVLETGELSDPIAIPAAATGTLNIEGPKTPEILDGKSVIPALVFDKTNYAGLKVNITGATAGSVITKLAVGDSLTTTTLKKKVAATATTEEKAAEQITISNGTISKTYVAGADGTMSFVDAGVLTDGVLAMTGTIEVDATGTAKEKYTAATAEGKAATAVTIAHTGTDTAIVTVVNGIVTKLDDLGNGTVTMTQTADQASAAYSDGAVTVTMSKAETTLTTLAMKAGEAVNFGSHHLKSGADGKVEFACVKTGTTSTDMQVKNGTLRLSAASTGFTTTGADVKLATDNETISYTKKTKSEKVNVTVTNGVVTKIEGLLGGDTLTIAKSGVTTKYAVDATTPTKVTKTVSETGKDDVVYTAFISEGGDVFGANYFGAGQDITEEENQIVGQLNWADVSGRATGYFAVNTSKQTAAIAEQSQKVTVTAKVGATALYAVANAKTDDEGREALTIDALQVQTTKDASTGKVSTKVLEPGNAVENGATLLNGVTLTVTAPTNLPLYYSRPTGEKAATYKLTVKNAATESYFAHLAVGDRVTTATLAAATDTKPAEYVQMEEADGTTVTYRAGAKGQMVFVGEGTAAQATSDASARLLSGTVRLFNGKNIYLAGGADDKNLTYNGKGNDLTVKATGDGNVIVKVAKGVISSVTGLDQEGATLEVVTGTGTSAATVKYTVANINRDAKGNAISLLIERVDGTTDTTDGKATYAEDARKTYRTVKTTADFYAGDQTKTFKEMPRETPTLTDWTTAATKYAFIETSAVATPFTYVFSSTSAKTATTGAVTSDVITSTFDALPGKTYYRMTAKTAANGMTTISAIDALEVDASSGTVAKLAVVNSNSPVSGTIVIDGASSTLTDATYAKITFALPAAEKRYWTLDAKNVALGSVFSNLTDNDYVASADGKFILGTDGKTFTVYTNGTERGTSTQVVTYSGGKGDTATAEVEKGKLTIKGLLTQKEKVTVVTDLDTEGLVTTEYLALAGGLVQKTTTAADGTKTIQTTKAAVAADADIISAEYGDVDPSKTTIFSDFNWTLDKSQVGYFAVSNNAATAKVAKTTITAKNAATTYIAVELDGTNGVDGVVKSVKAMHFDTATGKMVENDEGTYVGKITMQAPSGAALYFDRTAALNTDKDSVGANAVIAITGAAAGSRISNLKANSVYANCDSVTTAKLTKDNGVSVGGNRYIAGVNGALGFTMQQVNGTDDERVTLTSGTIRLYAGETLYGGTTEGYNAAIVGKTGIVATLDSGSEITVAASTKVSKGVATTTYTVGELGENESFQVLNYGEETVTSTFKKSSSNLFYIPEGAADDDKEGKYVYALKGATSVKSSVLTVTGKIPTAKGWATVVDTFTEGTDYFLTTTYGTVTVNLKTLDSRYAADVKKKDGSASSTYAFVYDKYVASGTKVAKAIAANVVKAADTSIQQVIGDVTGAKGTIRTYMATWNLAQSINATANWSIVGSLAADTITGASSGSDTLVGSAGNDSLVGGGAADEFVVGAGQDTIKSYASGKDTITITDDGLSSGNLLGITAANVSLTSSADVLLWNDTGTEGYDADDTSVLLVGMGNKKAVKINGTNYYFGSGKATKAETFTFDVTSAEQSKTARYFGKENLANVLSVGTDKTKATAKTLGDTLTVDLTDATRYVNIASIDASKSGNRIDLTAAATGSTLKGGTYQSTLRGGAGNDSLYGGSGVDVFWAEDLHGSDTVKSYQTSKDAVFLGNLDTDPTTATEIGEFTLTQSGKNVILTKGDGSMMIENAAASTTKALVISKDGTTSNTLSYYVGNSAAKANKFVATMDIDMKSVTTKEGDTTTTNVTMSSYYLGSAATNVDTLTLKSAAKNANIGTFDMNALNAYISTIDVIDTASLAKGSTIELIGRASGTYTLKGSNNVKETFNLTKLAANGEGVSTSVTITNLDVGEIVELAEGMTCSMVTSGKNTICTLSKDGTNYGQLTLTGVASSKLSYSSTTGKLTRMTK